MCLLAAGWKSWGESFGFELGELRTDRLGSLGDESAVAVAWVADDDKGGVSINCSWCELLELNRCGWNAEDEDCNCKTSRIENMPEVLVELSMRFFGELPFRRASGPSLEIVDAELEEAGVDDLLLAYSLCGCPSIAVANGIFGESEDECDDL